MKPVRPHGRTELVGEIADQAQLHGHLVRIRDLGLELEHLSVTPRSAPTTEPSGEHGGRLDLDELLPIAQDSHAKRVLGASWSPKWRLTTSHAASRSLRSALAT
jgi:hypothetical protein